MGWNLGCYACRILTSIRNRLHNYTWSAIGPLCGKWLHPQNRKYITHCNAAKGWPSHGHRYHAQKFGEVRPCGFRVVCADRQTDGQTKKYTHNNTSHPSRGRSNEHNESFWAVRCISVTWDRRASEWGVMKSHINSYSLLLTTVLRKFLIQGQRKLLRFVSIILTVNLFLSL